jgi:putative ABC transport system permease protein
MNDLTLIRKSVLRKKTRAVLLILSIMTAFLMFAVLASFSRSFEAGAGATEADRLVTVNRINFTLTMPIAYWNRVKQVDNVEAVTHASWFGGYFQEQRNIVQAFAVDLETYLEVYPELVAVGGDLASVLARNDCIALGADLAAQFEWTLGQRIPLSSNIWRKSDGSRVWEVDVCMIFDGEDRDTPTNYLLMSYDYYNESLDFNSDQIGWMILLTGDPANNDQVARDIDALFANSRAETETTTESAFGQAFLEQFGNITLILQLVIGAAFATILMIVGTTMVMAINERRREVAVMKTLGFSSPRIFVHVIGESVLLSLIGGMFGVALAWGLLEAAGPTLAVAVPGLRLHTEVLGASVMIMIAFGLVTGLLPALQALRLSIVNGLGKE